jgi:hypothetical protein
MLRTALHAVRNYIPFLCSRNAPSNIYRAQFLRTFPFNNAVLPTELAQAEKLLTCSREFHVTNPCRDIVLIEICQGFAQSIQADTKIYISYPCA